jgi:rod shape-determining protein MreC
VNYYRPFVFVAIIGLVFLALSRQSVTRPLVNGVLFLTEPVVAAETETARHGINLFSIITDLKSLAKENADLAAKNRELEAQLAQLKEVEHENSILREELSFTSESKEAYIPSQLIGRTTGGAIKDLIVNRGQRDSVSVGQMVMAQGYLIGLVSHVDERQSTISLLTHPRSIVPVLVQESRATGLLRGGIGGLTMTDLLIDAEVKAGDTVVTSGLGGGLESGVIVGKISAVNSRSGDITKKATVSSPIDITKLEMVFIRKGK